MIKYIVKRLLLMIPTLLGVAVLIFFLMRVVPGDIVELRFAGESAFAQKENLDKERARLGLDRPLWQQFLTWMLGIVRLDFGTSMWTGAPIIEEITLRAALSFQLAVMATIVAVVLAIPLGVLAALKQDTWVDYVVRIFSIAGLATPSEVLREDYIRTARAKGLWLKLILSRHALKNAMLPVLTVIALEFAFLMGGLVVTEQVFNLNGLGMLFVESVARRDYTLTQALVMLVAFVFIFVNFTVDLMYAWLDPRIRFR